MTESALYPVMLAVGLLLFAISFILPEPAIVMVTRIMSVVAFALAVVFAIFGNS